MIFAGNVRNGILMCFECICRLAMLCTENKLLKLTSELVYEIPLCCNSIMSGQISGQLNMMGELRYVCVHGQCQQMYF